MGWGAYRGGTEQGGEDDSDEGCDELDLVRQLGDELIAQNWMGGGWGVGRVGDQTSWDRIRFRIRSDSDPIPIRFRLDRTNRETRKGIHV